MAFEEFKGELDAPAAGGSFAPFSGELDAPAKPGRATEAEIDYGNAQGFSASEIMDAPIKAGGMGSVLESRAADRPEDPMTLDQLRALEKRPVPRAGEQTAEPIKGKTIPINREGTFGRAGSLVGAQLDSYSAGLGYKLGDAASAVGADAVAKDLRGRAGNLEGRADQANKSVSLSADGAFEKYAPQILAVFPTMAVAAATGGLPVMFGISEVQSYAEGRKAGLSPAAALGRAVPMGAAEVIGEKLGGTGKLLEALEKAAVKGGSLESLKELSGRMAAAGMREVPSEEATYAMQFGIDKAPGIGLKPNAGMADFLEGAKDTAIVAAGAGGMMAGGSMALNRLAAREKAFSEKYPAEPGTLPGVPPAPVDPVAAIAKAQNVDEAIAAAQAAVQSSTAVDNIGEILKQNLPAAQSTPAPAAIESVAGLSPDVAQTTQAITDLEAANVSPTPASPIAEAAAAPALDQVPAGSAAGNEVQPAGPGALLEAVRSESLPGTLREQSNVQNPSPRVEPAPQTAPAQAPEARAAAGIPAAAAGTATGDAAVQAAGVAPAPRASEASAAPVPLQSEAATARTDSLSRTASWVIKEKATGNIIMETFDPKKVEALNTAKYEAVPILQHLQSLNQPTATDSTPAAATQPTARQIAIQAEKAKIETGKAAPVAKAIDPRLIPKSLRDSDPEHIGKDNTPLVEGGKPFKTNREAKLAQKQQPMMRVVKAGKGYALAPKTEKQIAAQEKAGARLGRGNTGPAGQPISVHSFIADKGGLAPEARADMGMEGNQRIGSRWLFAGAGKGLTIERATEYLVEEGYLPEGASHSQALALIKRSLTQPQYTPEGTERMALAEAEANFADHLAAQEEAAQNEDPFDSLAEDGFDPFDIETTGYDELSDPIKLEVNALLALAESKGIDTDGIKEQAYEDTRNGSEQDYYEAAKSALTQAVAESDGGGRQDSGAQGDAGSQGSVAPRDDAEGLSDDNSNNQSGEPAKDRRPTQTTGTSASEVPADRADGVPATEGLSESTHNGTRIYQVKMAGRDGAPPSMRWAVESSDNKQRREEGDRNRGGDSLHTTIDEAKKAAEFEAKQDQQKKTRLEGIAASEKAEQDAAEARREANKGKSLTEIKAQKYMAETVKDGATGEEITRAEWVKRLVDGGEKPSIEMVNKIKPLSRNAYNRATNQEQAAHEKKIRDGGKVPEYSIGNYIVSKTEYDYAQTLAAEGLTSPTPADVLAQQQRAAEGDKAAAKASTAAADRARADAELPEFTLTGSDRAADADPNQGLMFSRAAKATEVLDAADIKGKDRLEALRDVRAGLITPDELEAAYPAKVDQTETPAFKKWFGASVVTDTDKAGGKPRVMYHGTRAEFEKFDPTFMYSGEGASQTGSGFYFTSDPESASAYATLSLDGSGQVMPVYLALKKPLHIDFMSGETVGADIKFTAAQVRKIIMSVPNIRSTEDSPLLNYGDIDYEGFDKILGQAVKAYAGTSGIVGLRNDFFGDDHASWLKAFSDATGYDSAYSDTAKGARHYVAWFPTQIKSAIGNNGDFNPADARIQFSRAPLEPVQTNSGATAFKTPEIALANPRLNVRQPGGAVTRIDFEIRDRAIYARAIKDGDTPAQAKEEATVGIITLDMDAAGVFKSLRNIEVFQSKRGAGIAEKVVGGIMESLPAGAALNIHDILPTATGFWDKMGAKFPRSEDTVVTANLTPEQFRSAYDSRPRTAGAQGQRQESRTAEYAGAGSGRSGADGAPAPRAAVRNPSTVERVQAAVAELIGGKQLPNKLGRVVATTASEIKSYWEPQIGQNVQLGSEGEAGQAQAFFDPRTKTVFLIADNIPAGDETAVAAHELMHKHGQAVLGKDGWDKLHTTINGWASAPEDSDERAVYNYARSRVEAVGMELSSQEMFPYAVEAAIKMGVKPSLIAKQGTVARWLGSVKYAMQQAWAKITNSPSSFTSQDLVDLAFGIAQMENPESAAAMGDLRGTSPTMKSGTLTDEKGKPLTLYHGGLVWDIADLSMADRGALWLTPEVDSASGYGDQYGKNDEREIKAFHVRMDKPLDLTKADVVDEVFGEDDSPEPHEIARDRRLIEQAMKYAKDNGYDGMIHPDSNVYNRYTNGRISYAVFNADQLQLAPLTGNEEDSNTYGIPLRGKPNEPTAPDSGGAPMFSRSGRSMNDSPGALKPESVDVVVNRGNPYAQLLRDGGSGLSLSPEERNFLAAFGNLLVREGVKPAMDESFGNGLMRNAELLSNLANAQPFIDQGYGGLDAPTKREVLLRMAGLVHNTQILRAVVELIPVDVMNVLTGQKSAPQDLGRDKSVLADLLPADVDMAITKTIDAAASVAKDTETLKAAKESPVLGGSNLGGVTNNGGGANGAGKVGGHSVPGSYWSSPVDYKLDTLIYNIADGRIDLKRVQEAIKAAGAEIAEKFDARLSETLYPGRVARRSETFLNVEVKPLLQDMALNKIDMAELGDYLIARHAPERNAQIAKVNPDLPDGGAGRNSQGVLMTDDAAAEYLAAIPAAKLAKLTSLARKVDTITAGTRALLVGEGLEKQETVNAWTKAYKNYVPLFKDEAEHAHPQGRGFTVKGSASKRSTGSTKEVTNVLAHVLMQRETAITRAEKNRVGLSLYGLALSNPNTDFWTTIKPNMSNEQIMAELQAMGVDPLMAGVGMASAPTVRTVDPLTDKVVDRPNPMYKNLPGAITLRVNGEDRVLLLNQDNERAMRMAMNLKNLDGVTQLELAGSIIGKSTRWIASVNTQYNPAFGLVNVTRDTLGGIVNLTNTPLRKQKIKVLANVPAALKGIARDLRGDTRTEWSDLFNQFQDDGGQTGFKEMFRTADDRAKAIEKEIAAAGKSGLAPGKMAHAVLDLLDDFNTALENSVRLSAYKAALDQGMSRPAAAKLARELTVDFNRKGRAGREIGPLYAFFNASVQGTARTLETLSGPAGAKIIAGGLALGGLQALMLAFAGFDEDEPPEFIKSRALIIPIGGDKRYIAIPYPLGLHVIPNTGRVLTELTINGGKDVGKRSVEAIGEIAGAFNPMGGGNIFTTDGALRTLAPTIVDPLIELAANKNFAGFEIEKKPFREEGDNRPGFQRARESTQRTTTGQVYLGISKAVNFMTGGNDFEAGAASPTPERVRYLAHTVGGGVLRELEKLVNSSMGMLNDDEVTARGIPVVGRFYGEIDSDQTERSRYFESSQTIEKYETSRKAADKAGATDIADSIIKKRPEVEMANYLDRVQDRISKLNKKAAETINDRAELKRIDEERFAEMKSLNDKLMVMEKAKRDPTIAERLRGERQP